MGAVFTTKTAPVAPLFLPTMSLSKNEDTAVQTERLSSSDLDAEKAHATEHAERLSELADPDAGKSPEERAAIDRKLMRKVDLWLIPWLCLLYLLSFLDRSNIGNARLAGMEEDLDMGGHDYNNALTIFFISYALAEPITNVLLKRLTPRVFFTGIILLWGLIMTLMGLVTNYSGLLACRWFLGLAEVSSSALLSAGAISTELSAPTSTSRGRSQNTTPATVPFWLTSSFACLEAPSSCIPCCARRTREGLVASGTTCMLESRLMTSGWLVITGRTSSILYDWIYGGHTLTRTALQIA